MSEVKERSDISNKKRRRRKCYDFDIIFSYACYVFLLSPPFSLHIFIYYFYYVIFLSFSSAFVSCIKNSNTDLENVFIEGKIFPHIKKKHFFYKENAGKCKKSKEGYKVFLCSSCDQFICSSKIRYFSNNI